MPIQTRIGLLVLLMLFSYTGNAQKLFTRNHTTEDGLPSNELYSVKIDKRGNVWFGSDGGAIRYDGYDFKIYDQSNSKFGYDFVNRFRMPDSIVLINGIRGVTAMTLDDEILCSTHLDEIQDKLHNVLKRYSKFQVISFAYNVNIERAFIGTNHGLYSLSFSKDSLWLTAPEEYEDIADPVFYKDTINFLKQDVQLIFKGKHYSLSNKIKEQIEIRYGTTHTYFYEENGRSFFTYENLLLEVKDNHIELVHNFHLKITSVLIDHLGRVWITAPDKGVLCYDNLSFQNLEVLLDSERPTCIVQDHELAYWVTTLDNGAFYIPSMFAKTIKIDRNCRAFGQYKDKCYVVTSNTKIYEVMNDSLHLFKDYQGELRSLFFDINKRLLVGFKGSSDVHGTVMDFQIDKNLGFGAGRVSFVDNNNQIFYGNASGINSQDPVGKSVFSSKNLGLTADVTHAKYIEDIIWLSGRGGLYWIDLKDSTFDRHGNPMLDQYISRFDIWNDIVVAGWQREGIVIAKGSQINESFLINERQGMFGQLFNSIRIENGRLLWVCTNKGLFKITDWQDQKKIKVQRISKNEGLLSDQVYDVIRKKDKVRCLTSKGITDFAIHASPSYSDPLLYLDSIQVNDQVRSMDDLSDLNFDENAIRLNFHAISFKNQSKILYHYRFPNVDTSWATTSDRFVMFSALSAGKYEIELRASDPFEQFYSDVKIITFHISDPFWKKGWFIFLVISFVISMLFLGFSIRLQTIKRRQILLQELTEVKQQSLSSQMNPHFIFNSLNSIQRYILQNDRKTSNKYLAKFSQLMRLVLGNSTKTLISLEDELTALQIYLELECLRFKEKMEFEIHRGGVPAADLKIPPLLLQPFVENAVWHGLMHKTEKGKITVTILTENEYYVCIIEDNGVGRKKAMEIKSKDLIAHNSQGMDITSKRIELANQLFNRNLNYVIEDVVDENKEPKGTKVILKIPYQNL